MTDIEKRIDPIKLFTVNVCVVTYGHPSRFDEMIETLVLSLRVASVAIVDNSKLSSIQSSVRSWAPSKVVYVDPSRNLGYSRGLNLGARSVPEADGILVINPDVDLDSLKFDEFLEEIAGQPDRAWTAPLVEAGVVGANIRPPTSASRELLKAAIGSRRAWEGKLARDKDRTHASGCFIYVPSEIWTELGGMDEQFELYYEDVALSDRLQDLGGVRVHSSVVGSHSGGESSSQLSSPSFLVLRISRLRYLTHRYGAVRGGIAGLGAAAIELVTHGLLRGRLPLTIRSLRLQIKEVLRPGSISVLP